MAKDIVYYKGSLSSNLIPYGLKDGKLVHISEVENGLRCGCVCPNCNAPLEANQGLKRSFFSHKPGYSLCAGAVESTLHLMAKEVLSECKCMNLPQGGPLVGLVYFEKIVVEERDDNSVFRPDCIGYCEGKTIWIEFKNSHAISNEKRGYILENGVDCVEVDISKCKLDRQGMLLFITKQAESRVWVKDVESSTPQFIVQPQECLKESFSEADFSAVSTSSFVPDLSVQDHTIRYAFDENHNFVDVRRIGSGKKLFCLVCGKPIKPKNCWNSDHDCKASYLRKSAQELLFSKFNNKDSFNIEIQKIKKCEKRNDCKYHDEERCCLRGDEQQFDIKSFGFTECVKDYIIPGTDKMLDLVFVSPKSIIGLEICENKEDYNSEWNNHSIRLIKILVEKPRDLNVLEFDPLSHRSHKFIGFSFKFDSEQEVSETNKTFMVFYVSKDGMAYYEGVPSCGLDNIKARSRYGIVFRRGPRSNDLKYGLLRCKLNDIKVCICEICFHLVSGSKCEGQYYCNRHKTKGTPKYPLNSKPLSCEYFGSNYKLDEQLMREYKFSDIEEFGI